MNQARNRLARHHREHWKIQMEGLLSQKSLKKKHRKCCCKLMKSRMDRTRSQDRLQSNKQNHKLEMITLE